MKGLAKFLVETILDEAAGIDKVVVVYSGRFQPFHKGHYATYDNLVRKFGKDSVYIGTSNVTDSKKSPFNFKEKKAIMMQMFGIPSSKIVNVKNPYRPEEITNAFAIENNEIYLLDDANYYKRLKRCIDDSLAHELVHYIQTKYQGWDISQDESLEWEAIDIQSELRAELCSI